jgi:hypothetical protein
MNFMADSFLTGAASGEPAAPGNARSFRVFVFRGFNRFFQAEPENYLLPVSRLRFTLTTALRTRGDMPSVTRGLWASEG